MDNILENKVWQHKLDFYKVILAMESRGIGVDTEFCKYMELKGIDEMERVVNELGLNPGKKNDLAKLLIDELELPIVKTSDKTGQPSFDKFAMEEYDEILENRDNPTAKRVLEYRGWQKAVSSYYKPYQELLSADGRLRPDYKLHGTVTGRLSCQKPNLQQIPKEGTKPWNGRTKECFEPAPGYKLVEVDYSQLELRLGTVYAQEESLVRVFAEGRDIFTEMSKELGMSRQQTKGLVYSIQYGAGVNRISNIFDVSRQEAQGIINNYYKTYPGFRKMTHACEALVKQNKYLRLLSGRRRHFKHESEARKSFNSLIQGGAADLVERAMVRIFKRIDSEDCKMLLQVHDSIIFEIKEDRVMEFVPEIIKTMVDHEIDELRAVKFDADAHWLGGDTITI